LILTDYIESRNKVVSIFCVPHNSLLLGSNRSGCCARGEPGAGVKGWGHDLTKG